jgi:hypothetical protein
VEAGSNTSTVALRVVGGDEKGNLKTLRVVGGDEKGSLKSEKIRLRVQRDSDPRKTTLASASSIYKSQTRPLVREDAHKNRAVIVKDK